MIADKFFRADLAVAEVFSEAGSWAGEAIVPESTKNKVKERKNNLVKDDVFISVVF